MPVTTNVAGASVVIQGLTDLEAKIAKMKLLLSKKPLADMMLGAMEPVRAMASQKALRKSGALASNIIKKKVLSPANITEVRVGPSVPVFYGLFHEIGFRSFAPRPFLRSSFDAQKDEVERILGNEIDKALSKVAGT